MQADTSEDAQLQGGSKAGARSIMACLGLIRPELGLSGSQNKNTGHSVKFQENHRVMFHVPYNI